MDFQFDEFDTAHFRAEPRRTSVGPWTVEHLSFADGSTSDRAPLVFIGGAFQNAWSFLREVKHFIDQRPIVIVDLPGQGQNDQLSGELGFTDLANLLRRFLDVEDLDRVIPVGLSYGSGIAFTFAQMFPHRIDRLILGGITERIRERLDRALRTSFWYLEHSHYELFSDAVVYHLLNLPQREVTGVSDRLMAKMREGMMELTDVERTRYRHNTARLFRDRLTGGLLCRTLIFTAKYDHFTAPFEGLAVADRCESCQFVMIERGDHLVPVENPRTVIALYDAFINDVPLSNVEGVIVGPAAATECTERRLLERQPGKRHEVSVTGQTTGEWSARLVNYNAHGCLLEMPQCPDLPDGAEPFRITIPSIGVRGDAVLLPATEGARAIFLHDASGAVEIPTVAPEVAALTPAPTRRRISVAERLISASEE